MEEAHRVGERILDEHALGVAGNEILGGRACVIGEQDGGLIVTEVGDEELAVGALKRPRLVFMEARITVFAMGGTSSSTVRQADAGRSATSASSLGERRRRVMKVIPAASSRSSPA